MTMQTNVVIPQDEIAVFCHKHHVRKLSLFGSVLREDFDSDSDIDVLVEFEPGHVPSLFKMAGLRMEIAEILGYKVDLRTPAELSRYFRQDMLKMTAPLYEVG